MRVQHNISAMNSYRNYNNNTSMINKNLEKLSSGYKINRAGDDAAGLAISEKMRAQITGLDVAQKNAKDGISLVQTAEGALTEVHSMLNRMFELAEQSANGTYEGLDREQLQKEVDKLKDEINRIRDSSNFNGQKLLDGSLAGAGGASGGITGTVNSGNSDWTDASIGSFTWDSGLDSSKQAGIVADLNSGQLTITSDGTGGFSSIALTAGAGSPSQTYTLSPTSASAGGAVSVTITGSTDGAIGTLSLTLPSYTSGDADHGSGYTCTLDLTVTAGTGSSGNGLTLQIGDTSDIFNQMSVSISDIKTDQLGTSGGTASGDADNPAMISDIDISTQTGAQKSLNVIKAAINYVSDIRGELGATQNRLEHTINNLSVMQENMQDAESTIRDTDVAAEMMKYTKNSILVQSAQAMLAQANQQPQGVLQLLQ